MRMHRPIYSLGHIDFDIVVFTIVEQRYGGSRLLLPIDDDAPDDYSTSAVVDCDAISRLMVTVVDFERGPCRRQTRSEVEFVNV